jgi:hypothetical protein
MMKIVTTILIAMLVLALGAGAFFYLKIYTPMAADYTRMKAGMPEFDKAKSDLKRYKDLETQEKGWMGPAVDALSAGLADEIKTGKAEVLTSGSKIVVNIAEQSLYMPDSYIFTRDSQQVLTKLVGLIVGEKLKGKDITIGNTTITMEPQGKARRRAPVRDARTLAADRSAALIRYLEKNNVRQDALIAAAYSSKKPEIGFKIKDRKTVILIENPPVAPVLSAVKQESPPVKPAPATQSTSTASTAPTSTAAAPAQPKPIPILPAQPKQQ